MLTWRSPNDWLGDCGRVRGAAFWTSSGSSAGIATVLAATACKATQPTSLRGSQYGDREYHGEHDCVDGKAKPDGAKGEYLAILGGPRKVELSEIRATFGCAVCHDDTGVCSERETGLTRGVLAHVGVAGCRKEVRPQISDVSGCGVAQALTSERVL